MELTEQFFWGIILGATPLLFIICSLVIRQCRASWQVAKMKGEQVELHEMRVQQLENNYQQLALKCQILERKLHTELSGADLFSKLSEMFCPTSEASVDEPPKVEDIQSIGASFLGLSPEHFKRGVGIANAMREKIRQEMKAAGPIKEEDVQRMFGLKPEVARRKVESCIIASAQEAVASGAGKECSAKECSAKECSAKECSAKECSAKEEISKEVAELVSDL